MRQNVFYNILYTQTKRLTLIGHRSVPHIRGRGIKPGSFDYVSRADNDKVSVNNIRKALFWCYNVARAMSGM